MEREDKRGGSIKWWNAKKGYGFITSDNGEEVFLHHTALVDTTEINDGDRVEYIVTNGNKGLVATDVSLISDTEDDAVTKEHLASREMSFEELLESAGFSEDEEVDMLSGFEDVRTPDANIIQNVLQEYFLNGMVKPLESKKAVETKEPLWIYIEVKGIVKYGMSINSISLMSSDEDWELYVTNSCDKTAGRKIEFYDIDDYNMAMAYLYDKLNSLIGLEEIKADVNNLVNLMKMQIRRKQQGLKAVPVSLHLVFSGKPETGKTTIARILADIYKEIGILSKGQLIEVDRAGLVAGYVGQTALKAQEKVQEAIDTILKAMEDNRDDFIVIVAGYTDLMETFINSNPGLKSRFNKYINFPDYSADEMIEIFYCMCKEYQYILTDGAKEILKEKIYSMEANKGENFANTRDVRNLFEEVITNQASRLANQLSSGNIMEIKEEDFM